MTSRKKLFPEILIPIFFIYNALVYLTGWPEITRMFLVVITGSVGYLFCFNMIHKNVKIPFFILLTVLTGLCSMVYNQNMRAGNFIATILYIGMAMIMLKYKMNHNITRIMFYGLSIFFLYEMFMGESSSEVLYHVSRNYISVLMLTNLNLLYLSDIDNNQPITLTPAILCFIISMWGIGRGGIITSGLLLGGILLIKVFSKLSGEQKKFFIIISGSLLVILLIILMNTNILLKYFVAFQTKGMKTPRTFIYKEYLSAAKETFMNSVLGPPMRDMRVSTVYSRNFHNSFIQAHAYYGLLFSIVIIFLLFNSLIFFIKRKNYVFVVLILTLAMRAFTDRLFFSGYAEPLLYYYCFYPLIKHEKDMKTNVKDGGCQ